MKKHMKRDLKFGKRNMLKSEKPNNRNRLLTILKKIGLSEDNKLAPSGEGYDKILVWWGNFFLNIN